VVTSGDRVFLLQREGTPEELALYLGEAAAEDALIPG
jgi:hypothetical protein